MASANPDPNAQQTQASSYATPVGAPPSSGPAPIGAPNSSNIPSSYAPPSGAPLPPQGQQAYSSPPPPPGGAYPQYSPYPPQGYPQAYPGAYGYPGYPPPGGQYPPPPSQYPPPPGQYPPPPGQYPPPPGQYPPPPGQYPPPLGAPSPAGQHPTSPPTGAPPGQYAPYAGSAGQYPPPTGAPPAGQYPPPTGAPPVGQYPGAPPAGQYHPPPGAPASAYQVPTAELGFPSGAGAAQSPYQPAYYPTPPPVATQPLWYLGTAIPDPHAPAVPHGVQKVPGFDPASTYNTVVRAINGANDPQLSAALLPLDVFKMDALRDYFIAKAGQGLPELIEKNVLGSFSVALRALTLGPLGFDVDLANKALVGFGTNEMLLTELILGRSGNEIRLLIEGYRLRYGKDLVSAVKSDLSGKTERMFVMALNGQRPANHLPVDHTQVAADIETLHHASKKKEELPFFEVLINRSNPHIAAVVTGFAIRYKSLSKVIKKTFSGFIEDSLLYILHGAKAKRDGQGFWRDAKLLEKSMAGLGTKDTQLIYRLVRAHWDPNHLEGIKDAYKRRYGKPLENRVKGETSGDYQKLLVAIVKSSENRRV